MKKIIVFIFALLLLSGCSWFQSQSNDNNQITAPGHENQTIDESTDLYFLNINYPKISLPDQEQQDKVNQAIKQIIDLKIENFKAGAEENGEFAIAELSSSLNINYSIDYLNEEVISMHFFIDTYLAGAAHGFKQFIVFNYDFVEDKEIELKDLFWLDSDYLTQISQTATNEFNNKFEDAWFPDGVTPDSSNFANFVLTQDSIVFLFEDYQVVAYAAGPQELEIPYQKLKELINENSIIKYIK